MMIIETATWGWPQWIIIVILFVGFGLTATNHGKPRLDHSDKTQPEKYNAFIALSKFVLWGFLLTAGGFFA